MKGNSLIYFGYNASDRWDYDQDLILEINFNDYSIFNKPSAYEKLYSEFRFIFNENNSIISIEKDLDNKGFYIISLFYILETYKKPENFELITTINFKTQHIEYTNIGMFSYIYIHNIKKIFFSKEELRIMTEDWNYLRKLSNSFENFIKDNNYLIKR